jgi:hypothetical protein
MDLKEVGCDGMEWGHLILDRVQWQVLLNTVISLQNSRKRRVYFDQLDMYQLLKKDFAP